MRTARSAPNTRRWSRLALAFSLTVSLVVLPANPARAAIDDYRDDFESGFSGSIGSADWATDWIENGESDGPGAGGIKVEVEPHCVSGACLTLGRLGTGGGNVSVEREADLSRASSATLQFDFKRHDHVGVSGQVVLEVSADGGGAWAPPLETWDLSVTDPAPATTSFDIFDYRSDDTRIRFRLINDTDQSHFNVDNLVITAENDLSPYQGGIVINEVLHHQTPTDREQFVELFNATVSTVSLAGWELWAGPGNSFYTFPGGASLASGEYAVIWSMDHDPGGVRDAPAAAFQAGAGRSANFLQKNGDAVWLYDDSGLRVDFVAWGSGIALPPPEWDGTFENSLGDATASPGQSISLTPDGVDGNDSACWEATTSGDASGRCPGYLPTADVLPAIQLWTPGVSNQGPPINQAPVFDQDLPDRSDGEGTLVAASAGATDPDVADILTYTATGLPEGITLNPATGDLTGALGPNSSGTHPVTITVTDDGIPNEQDFDTFVWTVSAGEVAYLVANNGGGNGGDDLLTAVDLTDPNPATNEIDIGAGTGTSNIESIALQPGTDTLFAIENDQLGTIDLTTGVFTSLPSIVGSGNGAVGFITFDNIESLTFNPFTGDLYAAHRRGAFNEDVLLRLDSTTGAMIPGAFSGDDYLPVQRQGGYFHVADLGFDPTDGQLYSVHWDLSGPASIATVDPDTGATATIGAVPMGVAGLAFDGTGGLWGTTADIAGSDFLYEFDKSDAALISTAIINNGDNYEAIAISFPFDPNQPPAFDQDLLDRADTEGTPISISAGGTDPDPGDVLLYTATSLPPGLTINPNSGLIAGTITYSAAGTYSVAITTTDDGIPNLNDVDTLTWTITEANQPPVFEQDLLDRSDAEGDTISLSAGATDPDVGDTLLLTAVGLPPGLSIDPGTGLITGTLTFAAAGTYPVTVTVTDDGSPNLNDVDTFTWSVANTNRPPVIVNPGAQTTPELAPFNLLLAASDPDLTVPSFSNGGTLPTWATLTDNLNGTATISGTPGGGDSATTTVTITADDGFLSDDAVFDLTVTNTNLPPVMVNPGNQFGAENVALSLTVSATDPDTTIPSLTDSGTLPGWATLTDHGDGTATIAGTPGYDDAGITTVTITASDGVLTDDADFDITVANTNRPPAVDPAPDQTVAEASALTPIVLTATDPDLTVPTLSSFGLPGWAVFADNLDGTGTISGTPGYDDSGSFLITITADDGIFTGDTTFTLTVTDTNRPPVVAPIADQSIAETAPFLLVVSASDPDLTVPFLNMTGLPDWASFSDNGDGTATISGTPGYEDAASNLVTITATDDGPLSATGTFRLTVTNTNRAPTMDPVTDQAVAEADPFTLTVTGSDPDLTTPALSSAGLPPWATLTDNLDGTATIAGTPGYADAGTHLITITADDGTLTDDASFTLTVTNTNRPPVVNPITNAVVAEGDLLAPIGVSATDPDLTTPTLSAAGLPGWATFTDNLDGTGTITGTPGYADAGTHLVTITAHDGTLTSATAFDLTITNTNRAPSIIDPGPQSSAEAALYSLLVSATDADGDGVAFSDGGSLPAWATLTDHGDGTATISGIPGYTDAATTAVVIAVTDGLLGDSVGFALTVTNTNRGPAADAIADQTVAEADPFTLTVTASDPDLTTPVLTAAGLPTWATLVDNLDGTATISGTPDYFDAATSTVTITVSDGALTDDATFDLVVTDVNRPPISDPIGPIVADEESLISFAVTASDPDFDGLSYSLVDGVDPVPDGASISAAGLFSWTPSEAQGPASYGIIVRVTDDRAPNLFTDQPLGITVDEVNQPPGIGAIPTLSVTEGSLLVYLVPYTDADSPESLPTFTTVGAPDGVAIDPFSGLISWTPTPAQADTSYTFTVLVSDNGTPDLTTTQQVTIVVNSPPPPPNEPEPEPPLPEDPIVEPPAPLPDNPPPPPAPVIPTGPTPEETASQERRLEFVAGTVERTPPPVVEQAPRIERTLVLMARTSLTTFSALAAPIWILAVLWIAIALLGRVSIAPVLGRRRRHSGVVGWYDVERGYGFVIDDETTEKIFVHATHVHRSNQDLEVDDPVTFQVIAGNHRSFARRVRRGEGNSS